MRLRRVLRPYVVVINGPVSAEHDILMGITARVEKELQGTEYIHIKHAAGPTTRMAFDSVKEALTQHNHTEMFRYIPSRVENISLDMHAPKGCVFVVSFAYYIPNRSQVKFVKPRKQEVLL